MVIAEDTRTFVLEILDDKIQRLDDDIKETQSEAIKESLVLYQNVIRRHRVNMASAA